MSRKSFLNEMFYRRQYNVQLLKCCMVDLQMKSNSTVGIYSDVERTYIDTDI